MYVDWTQMGPTNPDLPETNIVVEKKIEEEKSVFRIDWSKGELINYV